MAETQVLTFGCRLNAFESEIIRDHTKAMNVENTIVVNTCAVTAEAERQAKQAIRRARRNNPGTKIVVTGCAAQINPDRYESMEEVDFVLGNEEKLKGKTWSEIKNFESYTQVSDIMSVSETSAQKINGLENKARAFVQIQQGCDHRCTFCIIPFGRGQSRSTPVGEIVRQVRQLVKTGYKEVIFTGVDLTDYGKNLPGKPTLGNLCRRVLMQVPELPRLRISSVDPSEIDTDLLKVIAQEHRLLPHFHFSLQAGDNIILKRMKRRHCRNDAIEICNHIRNLRPNATFGADLIAGFPTETHEMFSNTLKIIEECDLTHLHVFPYSERSGTPAAKMPPIPQKERRRRATLLREAGKRQMHNLLKDSIGKAASVLVEKNGIGHCERYLPFQLITPVQDGTLIRCLIKEANGNVLQAEEI
ncbi:MAG: tRNA (N(6)-L-threonylcarbamoyladenosine(37)-C(2))-methylthiotransferase MtaB [Rhodospirillaceae bacterium]|nr:tRNA (N(6)-L-threonylcarbamoyladenosine(37)-C(2))-methylthiotransferase MtaB [Rhodospirillaceae bacterium]|tara:strand:+ start:2178 stop:3428 length:1251 start_codon:yes stop_codon:yes gene_type:complete